METNATNHTTNDTAITTEDYRTTKVGVYKSDNMEDLYESNDDPWGNRKYDLYTKILHTAIDKVVNLMGNPTHLNWYDIGCGGGNTMDGILNNLGRLGVTCRMRGSDISTKAIEYLSGNSRYDRLKVLDLEEYTYNSEEAPDWEGSDVISLLDVILHFGCKRPYKVTLDNLVESVPSGTIFLVADGLVRYQYRDYLGTREDIETLDAYTDNSHPMSLEVSDSGRTWKRYLKVRIYRKK